jgi:hypothetical protein
MSSIHITRNRWLFTVSQVKPASVSRHASLIHFRCVPVIVKVRVISTQSRRLVSCPNELPATLLYKSLSCSITQPYGSARPGVLNVVVNIASIVRRISCSTGDTSKAPRCTSRDCSEVRIFWKQVGSWRARFNAFRLIRKERYWKSWKTFASLQSQS